MIVLAEDGKDKIAQLALDLGAVKVGIAEMTESLKGRILGIHPSAVEGLDRAVSIAVRLSDRVMEDIQDGPTRLYFHHYGRVNYLLDYVALRMTAYIQSLGFGALPIPASQIIDWQGQRAHLSHKHVARQAGLGWIGRNNLLVTPEFGARVRLVTVLTDMPLDPDTPLERDCGSCTACLGVCPAGAIKEDPAQFDHIACYKMVDRFRKERNLGHHICGICVKACRGSENR